tara:strand:- start:17199 stop:17834 length:636 start_codon:yes stop_codon:yes gene_type:complete
MSEILLTILVPTVPSRINYFYPRIMKQLLEQTKKYSNIELLTFFDNKKRTIGEKRDDMLKLAKGKYVTFIDDDDRISDDYVDEIMNAITNNDVDCIVYNTICCENNGTPYLCKYGIEFAYGRNNEGWTGKPAHTMIWRRSIASKHKFKNVGWGEDIDWVKRAYLDIKTQHRIDKVLYYYDQNNGTTETRGVPDSVISDNIKKLIAKKENNN